MPANWNPGTGATGKTDPYAVPGSLKAHGTNRFGEELFYRPGQTINDADVRNVMFDNPDVLNRFAMEHTGKRLAPWGRARNLFEQNVAPGIGVMYGMLNDLGTEGLGDHGGSDIMGFAQNMYAQLTGQGEGGGFDLSRENVLPFLQDVLGPGRNETAEAILYHNDLEQGADNVISLLGSATFSMMDPISRGAFMSRLNDKRDEWMTSGFITEQTFVDYLTNEGFLHRWGIL